ncbi:S26 family signal peptidase [Sphingomonas sp. CJ20]
MTRAGLFLVGACAIGALVAPAVHRPVPRLVWNASASIPVGLYAARVPSRLRVGDLVAAEAPASVAALAAERGYLPRGVPLLKHVAALGGQRICRTGMTLTVDGRRVAEARARDRLGRPLPRWRGCRTLAPGEVLLLNARAADSFDGRYFGPVPARRVIALLAPLWLPGRGAAAPRSAPERREFSQPCNLEGARK